MAHGKLLLGRTLAKSAPERWVIKQRVVSESVLPTRFGNDYAFDRAMKDSDQPLSFHQCDHAHEPRGTLRNTCQFFQKQPVVLYVRRIRPGEPRRVDTGSTAQRVHFQAGIIGKQHPWSVRTIMPCLANRVLLKGGAVFDTRRQFAEAGEQFDINPGMVRCGQPEFAQLSRIAGSAVKPDQMPAAFFCSSTSCPTPARASPIRLAI